MFIQRHRVAVVTATGGGATGYTPVLTGQLLAVHYLKDGSNAFASTADFTITGEAIGESVLAVSNINASTSWMPRRATHTVAGAAALHATGGAPKLEPVPLAGDRVKIVVAQGGNTKNGAFEVVVG